MVKFHRAYLNDKIGRKYEKTIYHLNVRAYSFPFAACGGNDGSDGNDKAAKTKTQAETEVPVDEDEYINVAGCWMQTTEGDPFMLTFNDDNTMDYRAVLSDENAFFTEFSLEPDYLTINMVNTNRLGRHHSCSLQNRAE